MDRIVELQKGNKRAVARLISIVENNPTEAAHVLRDCWRFSHKAKVIGLTGPPGAGKSTLTDQLAKVALKTGKKIGIIAVDPSSPITGGAFLGDRVRMNDLNSEPNVFIRSMGTRGALGGIARAVHGAVRVLEAWGAEYIFVETVGVGQSEVDVAGIADIVVLVAIPGTGDDIQAEKAGILEVADVIVVNKADLPNAASTVQFLRSMLCHNEPNFATCDTTTEVVTTVAERGEGIAELLQVIEMTYRRYAESGAAKSRQQKRLKSELLGLVYAGIAECFSEFDREARCADKSIESILRSDTDPYSEAEQLLNAFYEWRLRTC